MQCNTHQRETIRNVIRECERPLSLRELLVEAGIRLLQEEICSATSVDRLALIN